MTRWIIGIIGSLAVTLPSVQDKPKLTANRPDEPLAKKFSLRKAIDFMDVTARGWKSKYNCVTCHTNGLYLAARAQSSTKSRAYRETRAFAKSYLEGYVVKNEKPRGQRGAIEGIVATTSFLAISDMATNGRLNAVTVKSLNHLWEEQDEDGAWGKWLKCKWPPYEIDDHFGVTLAALALGHTPSRYRRTTLAKRAEQRLRSYMRTNRPVNPHQKGMMLWLSTKLDDVVDEKAQKLWVDEFSDLQRADGGWRLVDLGQGEWKRPKDDGETLPSDAYATGFTIFVLRQAGVPKDHPRITNGLEWLRKHQRESGRWFVRSPRRDGKHFISHAATQFAVMAFVACRGSAAKK